MKIKICIGKFSDISETKKHRGERERERLKMNSPFILRTESVAALAFSQNDKRKENLMRKKRR